MKASVESMDAPSIERGIDKFLNAPGASGPSAALPTKRRQHARGRRQAPPDALQCDKWIYRIIVLALGLVLVIAVAGGVAIGMSGGTQVPEVVVGLGSGAVGALAGLLAPSP